MQATATMLPWLFATTAASAAVVDDTRTDAVFVPHH